MPIFLALAGLAPALGCGAVTSEPSFAATGAGASGGASPSGGESDAASSCQASDVLTYMQGNYQPAAAPSDACLGADGGGTWDDFFELCLGPNKSQDQCNAYKQTPANAACASCIVTPYGAPQLGPILDFGEFVGGNVAGCIEITAPSDPSCPKAVEAQIDCEIAACQANCPVSDSTSLTARQQCGIEADKTGCLSFFDMASACQATEAEGGLAGPCTNTGFKEFYDNVVPLFCGQAMVDAGISLDAGRDDGSIAASKDAAAPTAPSDAGAD